MRLVVRFGGKQWHGKARRHCTWVKYAVQFKTHTWTCRPGDHLELVGWLLLQLLLLPSVVSMDCSACWLARLKNAEDELARLVAENDKCAIRCGIGIGNYVSTAANVHGGGDGSCSYVGWLARAYIGYGSKCTSAAGAACDLMRC